MTDSACCIDSANARVAPPDLRTLNAALLRVFPKMSRSGSELGLVLYRELLKGSVVRRVDLAALVGKPTREVVAILQEPGMRCQVLYDEARAVIGFAGLSVQPTTHAFRVGDGSAFVWCAWDGFFIPPLLGVSAELATVCPSCKSSVHISVSAQGAQPDGVTHPVMSFLSPDANHCRGVEDSIASFCNRVNVFCSKCCADTSGAEIGESFLLSLHEAFDLGLLYNASRFGVTS